MFCCFAIKCQVTFYPYDDRPFSLTGGLFINNTGDVSDLWYSNITPSGATFSIWGIIYAWQLVFILYSLSTICRKGIEGYLYYSPSLLPPALFIVYSFNIGLNIAWLFLWDRSVENVNYLIASLCVLALVAFSLYICIAITCYTLHKYYRVLQKNGMLSNVWMIRFMVQNAFGIYATWTTVATLLNLGAVLTYIADVEMETTSLIVLSILAFEIVVWVPTDLFALDKYTRYLFTPHFVLVWALTGSFMKNYEAGEPHAIYITVLLALACFAFLVKIIAMIYRGIHQPLYSERIITPTTEENGTVNPGYDMKESSVKL